VIHNQHLLDDAHPELARRFLLGCERFGRDVIVNSVLRDTELQRQFWECYNFFLTHGTCPERCSRSECSSASAPGTSNHEPHGTMGKSLAIDAEPRDGDWRRYHAALEAEGLIFNIRDRDGRLVENWHCQCRETPNTSYQPGSEDQLPVPIQDPWEELFVPIFVS
jgi:hypothetical protein